MKRNPENYIKREVEEPVKVEWNYNKIMMMNGQMPTSTLTPEMLAKLKGK